MIWRLLLIGITAVSVQGAEPAGPSEFFIVSRFFSDFGAQFYYRVLEVKLDGSDSLIRYTRIAPISIYCHRMTVQSVETRVVNTTPGQIVRGNNPCAVQPKLLQAVLKKYYHPAEMSETVSFGIFAQCGSSSVSFGLPIQESVQFERLRKARPEIARLWGLVSEVSDAAFGATDIFHSLTQDSAVALQRTGERLVPELVSGRYDIGLAAAVRNRGSTSFQSLLESYRGPVNPDEVRASVTPQLINAGAYQLINFVAPKYPPLAMQARIQAKVELRLTLDEATGEVRGASVIAGHPLLNPAAIDASKQWRFAPASIGSEAVNVTLDFAFRCP